MPDEKKFLADIERDDAEARFAAWRQAGEAPATVLPHLGKLAASEKPGVAKAAREAMSTLVHSVGKQTGDAKRAAVVKGLLDLAGAAYALPVRVHAYRLLATIAEEDSVPAISKEIHNPELREEVVYCLEMIPGAASIQALTASYKDAKDDFKPRILAALGHRRASEAVSLCVEAMRSPDKEIAMAGVKAFGRIGKKPAEAPVYPDPQALSDWQKIEQIDSMLRYADAQAKEGSVAEAMQVYRSALERPEEHWQCAAIVGLARIGTAEAAAAILPKLKSDNSTVRITAQNAWKGMAAAKL